MAMLAEPRRKQKWTLNPRGKQWSEDSNKFGQKMLEKMGWTNGKGLGANEQGMTEHVKVSYKNNQSGVGFRDNGDQWTQHQARFDDFLSQLQQENSNPDNSAQTNNENAESLEFKSKQSRARVHYHKFTRGKDVKRYSSKDLANIFGKKELSDSVDVSKVEKTVEQPAAEPIGSKDNTGGVLTIKGGNIDEYFRSKVPNFVTKDHLNDDQDETEPRLGFGFNSVKVKSERRASDEDSVNQASGMNFMVKERNVDFPSVNSSLGLEEAKTVATNCKTPFSEQGFVNCALDLNDSRDEVNNGARFEVSRVEFGLENNALDLSDEDNRKKRVTFNDKVEYNTDVIRMKKKKKKKKAESKLDKFEVDNTKLRKKVKEAAIENSATKQVVGFVNEALDIESINDEMNDNELNERKTKKSKRRKNRRESNLETIQEIADENIQIDESQVGEAVVLDDVFTKGSKAFKNNDKVETSPAFTEMPIEAPVTQKKEKKAKKIVALEEPVTENVCKKKKDKTRKREDTETTVLAEISKKLSKNRKNKVANEPQSSDAQCEITNRVIESGKKKDKVRSKVKSDGEDFAAVDPIQVDVPKGGAGTKRRSSYTENEVISTKKSKLNDSAVTEDIENSKQNADISANISLTVPNSFDKRGRKAKKIFKSLFAKTPTLYFSGSNINEMAGYGVSFTDNKQRGNENVSS